MIDSINDVDMDVDSLPVVKKGRGGRMKGSKNKATLLKEALRGNFDDLLETKFKQILNVVAEQAVDGCRTSQKLILDRVIPTVHAESDDKSKHKFSGGISITIGSLENQTIDIQSNNVMDGDYTTIEEDIE